MKKVLCTLLCLMMLAAALPASAEPIQLEFWTVFTGDDGATMQKLVDEFNASQSDIQVTHTPIVAADLYTKLHLGVQTGSEVPDVCIIHIERFAKLIDQGVLTSVDYLFENGLSKDNYPDWVLEKSNFDGEQYGVPWDFNAGITYVNTDILEKYDLGSYIEDGYITFDEIKEIGPKLLEDEIYAINFYGGLNGYLPRYEELNQTSLTDAEGNLAVVAEDWAAMLESLRSMSEMGIAVPMEEDARASFLGGDLLFYEAGTWTVPTLEAAGMNYTTLPMPCYAPETALQRCGTHTFAMPEDEDRTEEEDIAAATFIDWMGAHSMLWSAEAGQVALYKGVTESAEFAEMPQSFLANAVMSDHVHIYTYYYWDLLDTALSHMGRDPIYDTSLDLVEASEKMLQEINDAIAAQ